MQRFLWEPNADSLMSSHDHRERAMNRAREYKSFTEFWPFYLCEHARPATRALHYAGTTLVVALIVFALVTGHYWWLIALPLIGYGFAWIAHFGVEKNRPATFTYPLWSLAADFRMWGLWLTGRLDPELDRAGVTSRRKRAQ
jgi:hypothetical protein